MDNQTQKNILIGGAIGLGVMLLYGIFNRTHHKVDRHSELKGHGPRHQYIMKHGMRLTPQQKHLIAMTKEKFPKQAMMLGGSDGAEFLANLIKASGAKRGFEIGVFTGYSTLTMAMALPEDGEIIAIDINKEFTDLGEEHWEKSQVENKINLVMSNAVSYLEQLCEDEQNLEAFDFAFVDADKQNYKNYYELLLKLIKKGGWICFDNAMAGGGVYDRNAKMAFKLEDSDALDELNREINADDRVSNVLIDIADGIHFVVKNQFILQQNCIKITYKKLVIFFQFYFMFFFNNNTNMIYVPNMKKYSLDEIANRLQEDERQIFKKIYKEKTEGDKKITVYADGCFDMFHSGHARLFQQIKTIYPNTKLVVGVCSSEDIYKNKGNAVMNDDERLEAVSHCRWVDEVIFPAPWEPSLKFMDEHLIDFIAHDTIPYVSANYEDVYTEMKKQGRFIPTLRTEGISTSDILVRILKDRDLYYEKNLKKGISREQMNLNYIQYLYIQGKSVAHVMQKCLKED